VQLGTWVWQYLFPEMFCNKTVLVECNHSYVYFAHFNNASSDVILVNSDKSVNVQHILRGFLCTLKYALEAAKIIL
jgi:hypothetical protein